MKVIKLCSGPGNGVDTACLMTATSMLIGKPQEKDKTKCVCPVIADFIRLSNDCMTSEIRNKLYSGLMWEIIGTKANDTIELERKYYFWNELVHTILPEYLDQQGSKFSKDFREMEPIEHMFQKDREHLFDLFSMIIIPGESLIVTAEKIAKHVIKDIINGSSIGRNEIFSRIINIVTYSEKWDHCPRLIRGAAAIGDKRPVEIVMTKEQLAEALG